MMNIIANYLADYIRIILVTFAFAMVVDAQSLKFDIGEDQSEFVTVQEAFQVALSLQANIADTGLIQLTVDWDILPGYYLYLDQFSYKLNGADIKVQVLQQPVIKYDETFGKDLPVFYDKVTAQMQLPQIIGVITLEFQGCADAGLCYIPTEYHFQVNTNTQTITALSADEAAAMLSDISDGMSMASFAVENFGFGWFTALWFAFLGGLILNLMPCVFPILALKCYGIINHQRSKLMAWLYVAGVIVSFLLIAVILILLRSFGEGIGWGFQLQSPVFLSILLIVFFIMGLSLSGLTSIGLSMIGIGQGLSTKEGYVGNFFSGFFAVLVATPCTAPFMAPALGYAIFQPAVVSLSIFLFLGIGMALPILILSYFPKLLAKIPRSGKWMEVLRQSFAFPMYLTCIWLLWVITNNAGSDIAALMMAVLVGIVMVLWMKTLSSRRYYLIVLIATAALWGYALLYVVPNQAQANLSQTAFKLSTLDSVIGKDRPVFVDVTADWCITCAVNERSSLHQASVQDAFSRNNVQIIIADWTKANPDITALLERYNRVGIPLYLFFPAGQTQPIILPQVLTPSMLVDLVQ